MRGRGWWLVGLGVALVCAGVVSGFASAFPDGLEYVAELLGFAEAAQEPVVAAPLADYLVPGVDPALSGGLAGVLGTVVVLAAGLLLARLLRRPATS
jgi:hypothetical protein